LNPHALRHWILSPARGVFRDQLTPYNAGNISSFSGTRHLRPWLKNPKVGTEWALKSPAESCENTPQSVSILSASIYANKHSVGECSTSRTSQGLYFFAPLNGSNRCALRKTEPI
jgi:hypothetical protein